MADRIPVKIDAEIGELVPGFLANRSGDVERLRALAAAQGFIEIRIIGHSMKGAGGGYGFDRISEIGAAIEEAALRDDAPAVFRYCDDLADYLARVDVVLDG